MTPVLTAEYVNQVWLHFQHKRSFSLPSFPSDVGIIFFYILFFFFLIPILPIISETHLSDLCCMWWPVKHQKHAKNIISIWGSWGLYVFMEGNWSVSRWDTQEWNQLPGKQMSDSRTWCQSAATPSQHLLVTAASKYWKTSKSGFYCQPFLIHPVFLHKWQCSL